VIRDGETGTRSARSHKVTFTLDDIFALKGKSRDILELNVVDV